MITSFFVKNFFESQRNVTNIIERFSQQQLPQSANTERSESREQTADINSFNNEARRTKADAQKPSTLQVGISLAEFSKWRKSYNDYGISFTIGRHLFCNTIKKAAKKTIPRGYRNNYIPCWDAECESFYKTFLQSPQGDDSSLAATALLAKLDRKRRDRWSEAVGALTFHTLVEKRGVF